MINNFNFCPMCASKNIQNINNLKWVCPDCNFELYCNIAAAVGIIIYDDFNNVLFEVRAKDPKKGFLALPGGFVDADEKAEDAIVRECLEEIGLEINDIQFLSSNPNTYEFKNFSYKTCDFFFTAKINKNYKDINDLIKNLLAQESEVEAFTSYQILKEEDIDKIPLAFDSAKKTLKEWVQKNGCK